jgi:hypothetical protein
MKRIITVAAVLAAMCSAGDALAAPSTTAFTARLSNSSGPITGAVTLGFRILDAPTGGTAMWAETHNGVTAQDGLVFVALGSESGNGLDSSVFTGGAMYLEITVNGELMNPRLPIVSVPYAISAASAERLGSLRPSDVALAGHNHDASYAPFNHNHDSAYASLSHNHDSSYASISHNHDTRYYSQSALSSTGTINSSSNPVAWSKLKGVPASLADGTDNAGVTQVTAGSGLTGGGSGSSVSVSVATGGINSTHLANNSVGSSEISTNAVGADEIAAGAVGASELGIQHNHGFVYDSSGLANGFSYIWPSAGELTATETAKCYIWTRLRTIQGAQSGTLRLQPVTSVDNGSPTGGNAIVSAAKGFNDSYFSAAAMDARQVQAGKSYRFGCGVSASGDFVGDGAYCDITYICM